MSEFVDSILDRLSVPLVGSISCFTVIEFPDKIILNVHPDAPDAAQDVVKQFQKYNHIPLDIEIISDAQGFDFNVHKRMTDLKSALGKYDSSKAIFHNYDGGKTIYLCREHEEELLTRLTSHLPKVDIRGIWE